MDLLSAVVQVAAITVAYFVGAWTTNRTHDRERAIADQRLARALLADLARLKRDIGEPSPEVARGTDGLHSLVQGLAVEMVKVDPDTLAHFVAFERDLSLRTEALGKLDASRGQVETHEGFVRRVSKPDEVPVDFRDHALSQAATSREYLPQLHRELAKAQNEFDQSDKRFRDTLAKLESQLRKTADSKVAPATPFDDSPFSAS